MKRFLSIVRVCLRFIWRLLLGAACAALAVLLYLSFFQAPLPDRMVRAALEKWTPPGAGFTVTVERADASLRRLNLHGLRVFEKHSLNTAAATAHRATLRLVPQPSRNLLLWVDGIVVQGCGLDTLPDSLFSSGGIADAPALPATPRPLPVEFTGANIFGIPFERVAAKIETTPHTLRVTSLEALVRPPGTRHAEPQHVYGEILLDLPARIVDVRLEGRAALESVDAFMARLRIPEAHKQLQRIRLSPPLPEARFHIAASYATNALALSLDVENASGAYRGIPLSRVTGRLSYTETNGVYQLRLADTTGFTEHGAARLDLVLDDDGIEIEAVGTARAAELNTFAEDLFDAAILAPLDALGPVDITLAGFIDFNTNTFERMALRGTFAAASGRAFGLPVKRLAGTLVFNGPELTLDPLAFQTPGDGECNAAARIDLQPPARLSLTCAVANLPLSEAAHLVAGDPEDAVPGLFNGRASLVTPLADPAAIQAANGSFVIREGRLARVPLFAGFTDFMARNVPGIDWLTQQTVADVRFTIDSGLATVTRMAIRGNAFSIVGDGTYDIPGDSLHLTIRAHLFADRTLLGHFSRLVASPLNYLLLTFRVTGPRNAPLWSNVGAVHRARRAITSLFTPGSDAVPPEAPLDETLLLPPPDPAP